MASYNRIGSVKIMFNLLRHLALQKQPVSGADVAAALGMKHSLTMSYLDSLLDEGAVSQVSGRYKLGMTLALFWSRVRADLEGDREQINNNLKELGVE